MAEILIESSYRGMPVRLVVTEREVCYVIHDVCDILGYSNPNRALAQFCNNRPQYTRVKTGGGNPGLLQAAQPKRIAGTDGAYHRSLPSIEGSTGSSEAMATSIISSSGSWVVIRCSHIPGAEIMRVQRLV